jgi:ketosteroid isomerase-like protein
VERDPIAMAQQMCEAMNRGDFDALERECAPDVEAVILSPTEGRLTLRGLEAVRAFWEGLHETWGDYTLTVEHLVSGTDDRFAYSFRRRGRGRLSGIEVDELRYQVVTLRDGRVARFENMTDRESALRGAGVQPPDS